MAPERARSAPAAQVGGPAVDEAVFAQLVAVLGAEHVGTVCRLFIENAESGVHTVRQALDSDDTMAAADAAHRLKSASGFVGATRLAALCASVEAGEPPEDTVEAMVAELRRTSVDLDLLVGRMAGPSTPSS